MRPFQLTSYYLNEDGGNGGSGVTIAESTHFFQLSNGSLEINNNTSDFTPSTIAIFCNIITTVINGRSRYDVFINYNIAMAPGEGNNGDLIVSTVLGTGTPDELPLLPQTLVLFGTSQLGTSASLTPIAITYQDGVISLQWYGIGPGSDQRGMISRTFLGPE